ncbi:MAG TPA: hypothetical protein VFS04_06225 [Alphaproteobacteria bacterium]|nr:hypothetical protein [Alphaproteobacteria bacterium]
MAVLPTLRRAVPLVFAAAAAFATITPGAAQEQQPQGQQESLGSWFKNLNVPGTKVSCCDESDCKRTQARLGPAGYEAQTPEGRWISIPESAIIRGKANLAREPVLCLSPSRAVYCFVPDNEG